jgi:hypothetical protein
MAALDAGIPMEIVSWRLKHHWPLSQLAARTIDRDGMH